MRVRDDCCNWRAGTLVEKDQPPLAGKRIVVTRAAEQAGGLQRALEEMGAEVLLLPLIHCREVQDFASLDGALRSLAKFNWLIFTSANAVQFVSERGRELGVLPISKRSEKLEVAAVGPATAAAAADAGFTVSFVATRHSGRELAAELESRMKGTRVLLPRSDRADSILPKMLREAGAEVKEVVAYRTESAGAADDGVRAMLVNGEVDAVALASPSAFHALGELLGAEMLRGISEKTALAAIGPTTAAAIREAGCTAAIEAKDATAAGLAEALKRYLEDQQAERNRP